ncbi:WSC-domain-containing protein [Exidia glandulosa HHB12029]|uniref:WSC-domain-containing protein n=1 Tax=Exidia glandulosa HHB12029 TaxID=1314781 RepID=A0A166BHL8_EXIGL|nr:WSC-domain-containing protein [Exidia glandulosa HHB12029]
MLLSFTSVALALDIAAAFAPSALALAARHNVTVNRRRVAKRTDDNHAPVVVPANLPDSWTVLSTCAKDDPRVMVQPDVYALDDNTPLNCVNYCDNNGYTYAGVEWGKECWCARAIYPDLLEDAPETECNMPCAGDATQACGAGRRVQLFFSTSTSQWDDAPLAPGWSVAVQCAVDSTVLRTLCNDQLNSIDDINTPEVCTAFCAANGYSFAGVEYGQECHCGTGYTLGALAQIVEAPKEECYMACTGDETLACGAPDRVQLYVLNNAVSPLVCVEHGTSLTSSSSTSSSSTTSSSTSTSTSTSSSTSSTTSSSTSSSTSTSTSTTSSSSSSSSTSTSTSTSSSTPSPTSTSTAASSSSSTSTSTSTSTSASTSSSTSTSASTSTATSTSTPTSTSTSSSTSASTSTSTSSSPSFTTTTSTSSSTTPGRTTTSSSSSSTPCRTSTTTASTTSRPTYLPTRTWHPKPCHTTSSSTTTTRPASTSTTTRRTTTSSSTTTTRTTTSSSTTTTRTTTSTSSTTTKPCATSTTSSAVAPGGQCGGFLYFGSKTCTTGYTCKYKNILISTCQK